MPSAPRQEATFPGLITDELYGNGGASDGQNMKTIKIDTMPPKN
jgi:hypothetical protein